MKIKIPGMMEKNKGANFYFSFSDKFVEIILMKKLDEENLRRLWQSNSKQTPATKRLIETHVKILTLNLTHI